MSFPAVRGVQAGREYYVVMCQLRLVPKLFIFDEEEVRPELRAQRTLNRARVPEIARYLINNPTDYIFSALTASIDGKTEFQSANDRDYAIGQLVIPLSARLLINDGQHRRAAIEEALRVRPELGDETIAVVLFLDTGLERSQQMFADLNTHAIRPSMSIEILYNHRNPTAQLVRELSERVPVFQGRISKEKTTISNRSSKLFTLSALYQATSALLGKTEEDSVLPEERDLATAFWTRLGEVMTEWRAVVGGQMTAFDLRNDYVSGHGIALQALGHAGADLVHVFAGTWEEHLSAVGKLDWRRANSALWEGRALLGGKVSAAHRSVMLTTNVIKQRLALPLGPDEQRVENEFHEHGRTSEDADELEARDVDEIAHG